ncbi:Glyoxalase/Bleomycin resistance protein/Dihydroxybiphenyl dioxygenase [Paraphoma chrysanthemicola]|uniref:Glyoxalase/Bleomycin resistance protein/Dihydroxybiphenyl dioxygenase n=1 Tax=Paraphoma chrysanthemicola TaxID=798071 RepID=A0A8K0R459_9PLEO|nr:Glyoxalase/Bleomycin resistance protein/Dihydroxybiphenyl dioxygenase [Paraphoma chrysanthemicola]
MSTSKIRVLRLAYVHYQHPDLQKAVDFLIDFGLDIERRDSDKVYLRGYGIEPYLNVAEQSPDGERHFMGGAWEVDTASDLEKAAAMPDATEIRDNDGPGGGKIVSVQDPNGMLVHFVYGQNLRAALTEDSVPGHEITSALPNGALKKQRKGEVRRFTLGPSRVHKVGHYGFAVPKAKFAETRDWYTRHINMKPTDSSFDPVSGKDENCFIHIDLGQEYTDHHSFFLSAIDGNATYCHHSSYEVNDYDEQTIGHHWLEKKGWTNCWGIGRHVLGSQIFDYWFDGSGNIVEHYLDGDLVNEDTPERRIPADLDSLFVWGPDLPLAFVTTKLEDAGTELVIPPDALGSKPAEFKVNTVVKV